MLKPGKFPAVRLNFKFQVSGGATTVTGGFRTHVRSVRSSRLKLSSIANQTSMGLLSKIDFPTENDGLPNMSKVLVPQTAPPAKEVPDSRASSMAALRMQRHGIVSPRPAAQATLEERPIDNGIAKAFKLYRNLMRKAEDHILVLYSALFTLRVI